MELHYYTLKRQAFELSIRFKDARIEAAYTQKKNEMNLQICDRIGEINHLVLSTDPQYPFILSRSAQGRSKRSKDIMKELVEKKIHDIKILPSDRIIVFEFIPSRYKLLLQYFLKRTNFFIVDENYKIEEAFKQNKKYSEQKYSIPISAGSELLKINFETFTSIMYQHPEKTIFQALKKHFYELNNTVLKEIEFRSNLNLSSLIKETDEKKLKLLFATIQEFLQRCLKDHPRVYIRNESPFLFCLADLKQYKHLQCKKYDTVNEALTYFIFSKQRAEDFDKIVIHIKSLIESKLEQLEHLIQKLRSLPDEREQKEFYQKMGELILAQMLSIKEGCSQANLIDYFDPKQPEISVILNPGLSVHENAQHYFNKSRKVAENRRQVKQNLMILEKQKNEILHLQGLAERPLDWKALNRIEKKLQEMHIMQTDGEKLQEIYKPYKQHIHQGWEIWIGKSAKDNDEMTFKRCNREDIWLHAQGVSGSHVIIRSKDFSHPVPQQILFHAAQLAAGHSRAKHSSYVPVIYTKVKYVRKPKGSAPGEVSAERVKSIFAEPLLK
jgi:predicted ribosome quality control (RQC) complex YloA/Tae2 family protein